MTKIFTIVISINIILSTEYIKLSLNQDSRYLKTMLFIHNNSIAKSP